MSYILDALRKADAQRERSPARGIHAQPARPSAVTARARPSLHWLWAGAAFLILLATGWMWVSGGDNAAAPAAVAVPAPLEAAPAAAPPAAAVLPAPPPPVIRVAPQEPPAPAPAQASAPVPAPDRVHALADLPPDVQQALPKFAVSGGVYSENVAQRMLVVNGQVFNEGSEIAPGVVLEQVRPRVAVLKFRGLRIAQPY